MNHNLVYYYLDTSHYFPSSLNSFLWGFGHDGYCRSIEIGDKRMSAIKNKKIVTVITTGERFEEISVDEYYEP